MNARHGMTCARCCELLMDLVCEQLDADDEAAVRAHAHTCERCSAELAKLEAVLNAGQALPIWNPGKDVERRIMQAARDAISDRAKGPVGESSGATRSTFGAWFTRIGAWAMSPQVAMASVLLLVVGIGLYALPLETPPTKVALRESEEDTERTAPEGNAKSAVEAPGHAASEVPAERAAPTSLDEKLARSAPREPTDEPAAQRGRAAARSVPAAKRSAGKVAYDALEDTFSAPSTQAEKKAPENKLLAARPKGDSESQAASESKPNPFAAPPPAAAPAASSAAPARDTATRSAEAAGAAGPSKADARDERPRALADGIAAVRRGDAARARQLLLPIVNQGTQSERMQAALWLARSLRAQNDCTGALEYYRPLSQSTSASHDVLEETADCLERSGQAQQAATLRARLAAKTDKQAP